VEDHALSRTYRRSDPDRNTGRRRERDIERPFRCCHCKAMVGPVLYGGSHRNHCPYCLHSCHVDGRTPGDRASACHGKMAPAGVFTRRNGEHVILHRCLTCGFERHNRIAADDWFDLVLSLPLIQPRISTRDATPVIADIPA
jgi:hypothetical protein